ncbi:MAG: ABC transporter permease [Burkholderiales bacterium]|jgi:cell division transport system permease protein|nr:ABC transporter permease [Burkholderiales bacterium]
MRGWLRHHRQSLAAALRRVARDPLGSLLNALVIGVALALPLGAFVALATVERLVPTSATEPEMSVFLDLGATRADADRLRAELARLPGVRQVRFVPKDQALAEMGRTEGLAEIVAALGRNPLPDAFVLRLAPGAAAEDAASRAGGLAKVAKVQVDTAWVQRLQSILALGRAATLVLAALLGVGLVAATFNTVRLQLATRRDEVEVSRLVGATDAWIRRPFLYLGAVQGVLGALLAGAIVAAASWYLTPFLAGLARLYGGEPTPILPPPMLIGAATGLAAILGLMGAWISVSVHLRDRR